MISQFKRWFKELEAKAIETKKSSAKAKGDENKWRSEVWRSPNKNQDIKLKFTDEAINLGYKPRSSATNKGGEWLYDLIWRKFNTDGSLNEIILSMEIELSDCNVSGLKYDFNKLLQADSLFKVFVFQQRDKSDVNTIFELLSNAAFSYKTKTPSHYLMCGWSIADNEFIFHDFELHPTNINQPHSNPSNEVKKDILKNHESEHLKGLFEKYNGYNYFNGEIEFWCLTNDHRVDSLKFKFDNGSYIEMKKSGFRTAIIELADELMSNRATNDIQPYHGGIITLADKNISIKWLNEAEIMNLAK